MAMFCRNCGTSLPDDSAFCQKCGQAVDAVPSTESTRSAGASEQAGGSSGIGRGKYAVIAIGAVAVVAIAVIVAFALAPRGGSVDVAESPRSQQDSTSSAASASEGESQDARADNGQNDGGEQDNSENKELQAAFGANPSTVYCAPSQTSDPVSLTGAIVVHEVGADANEASPAGNVYLLELPEPITVTGTQYGDQESNLIALNGTGDTLASYEGKDVTMNLRLSVRVTASIASAEYTCLQGSQASVERVFGEPDGTASPTTSQQTAAPADRDQLAHDAAMALFTSGTYSNGSFDYTGCTVADYLAPGSPAAAQYSDGWTPGGSFFSESAEITSQSGDVYDVRVLFNTVRSGEAAARDGDLKVYFADVSLTFDANDKVTDITGTVI